MEYTLKEKLERIGEEILSSARNEIYLSMRYLDIALTGLSFQMNVSTMDIGTDGERIYFNPKYIINTYETDYIKLNRAYLHMVIHCIFRHLIKQEDREADTFNLACDIAAESIIDSLLYTNLSKNCSEYRQSVYEKLKKELKVLSVEGIYQIITNTVWFYQERENLKREFYADDHVFWPKKKEKNQDGQQDSDKGVNPKEDREQPGNRLSQEEVAEKWKKISEQTQTNMETYYRNAGKNQTEFEQQIKFENRVRYDYRTFLKKFAVMREELRIEEDSFDLLFYTYGMQLYGNIPLIEPLEQSEVKRIEELVIVIDTSGSCPENTIRIFLEETFGILRQNESFFKHFHVRILCCDQQVHSDTKITSKKELDTFIDAFSVKGFGGTDFRPAFEYTIQLMEKKEFIQLKGLLYFTDGYGIFPKKKPPFDTAFIFLREDGEDAAVPPWAVKIIITQEELGDYHEY